MVAHDSPIRADCASCQLYCRDAVAAYATVTCISEWTRIIFHNNLTCVMLFYCYFSSLLQSVSNNSSASTANSGQRDVSKPRSTSDQLCQAINFVFTILIILAVFYITYLPVILTISLLWVLLQNPNLKELILRVSILLGYLASSLNPLIFIWRMKDIRNEVITLLKGMFCKSS